MDERALKTYQMLMKAGMVDEANELRSAWDKRSTRPQPIERSDLSKRAERAGVSYQDLFPYQGGTQMEAFAADFDYEMGNLGYGLGQLGAALISPITSEPLDHFNQTLEDRRNEYNKTDLPDRLTGGRVLANVATMGPVGSAAGAILPVARGPLSVAARSAGVGVAEEIAQPTYVEEGETFAGSKAKDLMIGGMFGLGSEVLPRSLMRGAEEAVYLPGRTYKKLQDPVDPGTGVIRPESDVVNDMSRTADETGIPFTPGQMTQSSPILQAEELARSNIFTRRQVEGADDVRRGALEDYITKFRDELGNFAPIEVIGQRMQDWGRREVDRLVEFRRNIADQDYRPIQNFSGGAPVIPSEKTKNILNQIVDEGNAMGASQDQVRAGMVAQRRLERLNEQGGFMTGSDVDMLTRANDGTYTGSAFDAKNVEFDDYTASRVRLAVEDDLRNIPELHKQLQKAKSNYANTSDSISHFENTILGKAIGKEFASDVIALGDGKVNNMGPERIYNMFMGPNVSPHSVRVAMEHLKQKNPEMRSMLQASLIDRARQAAKQRAASGGIGDELDPGRFLSELGIKPGSKGLVGLERLEALFPDHPEFIEHITRAAYVMADSGYKNTSRTDVSRAGREAIESATSLVSGGLTSLFQGVAQVIGSTGFYQRVAKTMDPRSNKFGGRMERRVIPGRNKVVEWSPYTTAGFQTGRRDEE